MHLVVGKDQLVADWVATRIPHMTGQFDKCTAIGVANDNGELIAGVVYNEYRPACRSIEMHFAATRRDWLSRQRIKAFMGYPFDQLKVQRVTAVTPRRYKSARRFLEKFGFKREGLVRKGFGSDDAVISGMLEREWRSSRWAV